MNTYVFRVLAAVAFLLGTFAGAQAQAPPVYHLTDIGSFVGGNGGTTAAAINEPGQVVGSSDGGAFLYSNGGLTPVGMADALSINASGQIVGGGNSHGYQPMLYGGGTLTSLYEATAEKLQFAVAINDAGQIAGTDNMGNAAIYSGGTVTDLGNLGGNNPSSTAAAINASGQVVGTTTTASGSSRAFLYSNGAMTNLGTLGGGGNSSAYAINAGGQIVGSAPIPGGESHAFLYNNGTMNDLGTLPGQNTSSAVDINDSGQIIGESGGPFLYTGGTMYNLDNYLDSSADGWTLQNVVAINDNGWIVANASNGTGNLYAVLLTPAGPPTWTGASNNNWSNAGNWSGAVAGSTTGTTNTDTALFEQATTNSQVVIDAGRNVQSITFDTPNVSPMTIGATSGNALLLTSGGTIQTTSTVINPQNFNAPLVLEGGYTFTSGSTTGSATLSFGGGIMPAATSGTTTLTLDGSNIGANIISGILANNGAGLLAIAVIG